MIRIGHFIWQIPANLLIASVRVYQLTLSHLIGGQCRFTPSCSAYFIEAVRKYGAIRGSWLGVKRIARCNPWHPGGEDLP
jgi:putative membrane protein insertion efficiency factor